MNQRNDNTIPKTRPRPAPQKPSLLSTPQTPEFVTFAAVLIALAVIIAGFALLGAAGAGAGGEPGSGRPLMFALPVAAGVGAYKVVEMILGAIFTRE